VGTGGCGFEQPLEAARTALVQHIGSGGPNAGFLRDDALLAIIFVTDEDDCSAPEASFYDPDNEELDVLNLRCVTNSERLYPVERYVEDFRALRSDDDLVVVAAISGLPEDGSWDPGEPIEALRALQRVVPETELGFEPSCMSTLGVALPPVRFAGLAQAFGSNGVLSSICRNDWTPALDAITRKLQKKIAGVCLASGPFITTDDTRCRLVETLSDARPCPHLVHPEGAGEDRESGWQVDLGVITAVDGSSHRQCQILPADYDGDGCPDGATGCRDDIFSGGLDGWFFSYDDADCEFGSFLFSSPGLVEEDSNARYECRTSSL
jgi:hypothetical protein